MSTHEPLPNASSSAAPSHPAEKNMPGPTGSSSARIRSIILAVVLVLLIGALWYDYKIARPGVESAFNAIEQVNGEINAKPGKQYVTEKVVQQTLNRAPQSSYVEGPYRVEVYSWRAGLPIRSHNYYAVYAEGNPLVFLKHYKFELPLEELKAVPVVARGMTPPPGMSITPAAGMGAAGGESPPMRPRRPESSTTADSGEADPSSDGSALPAELAPSSSSDAETPARDATPAASTPPPADAAPAASSEPATESNPPAGT